MKPKKYSHCVTFRFDEEALQLRMKILLVVMVKMMMMMIIIIIVFD